VWQDGAPQPPHGVVEEEDEIVEDAVVVESGLSEEPQGLRERLSSLIGRDLTDRQSDPAARVEPPLASAPVPQIEPTERAIHAASQPEQSKPASEPLAARQPSAGSLAREDLRKLHAALHELTECRKLIDAAVTRPH